MVSNKNSTPNSGFSWAGGSAGGLISGSAFGGILAAAGVFGWATAFAFVSGLKPAMASCLTDFDLGKSGISSNGDLGAALAVAEGLFVAAGFAGTAVSLRLTAGSAAAVAFAFTFPLRLDSGAGFAFFAGLAFEIFAARGDFLAGLFFGDFATFKVFAPALVRLGVARLESGFAAVIFFGFFMATILAMGGAFAA